MGEITRSPITRENVVHVHFEACVMDSGINVVLPIDDGKRLLTLRGCSLGSDA